MKILILAAVLASTVGMTNAKPQIQAGQNLTSAPPIVLSAWTASDQPYKTVEGLIKKEYAQGKSLGAIAQEYKATAQQRPSDPVAQLAWIYAARGAAVASSLDGSVPYALVEALAKSDPGNVHEYTRYRFCMTEEANKVLPAAQAKRIGDKLLAYDPHDDWVRLHLINMLCDGNQPDMAQPYALAWTKQEPNNPKAHSALGLAYFDLWEVSHRKNKTYGNESIAEYQQYLRLAPPNDHFRPFAEKYIKYVQQDQG